MTKAIETAGIVDEQHRLVPDGPLPIAGGTRVRVIVLVPETGESAARDRPGERQSPTAAQASPTAASPSGLPKGMTPWRAAQLGIKTPSKSEPPPSVELSKPAQTESRVADGSSYFTQAPTRGENSESPAPQYLGGNIPNELPPRTGNEFVAEIVIRRGARSGTVVGLRAEEGPRSDITIGSAAHCRIVVPDDGVLRNHAKLSCRLGKFVLHDLAITSRTTLNGNPLDGPTELLNGDVIGLASVAELVYRQPASGFGTVVPA